MSVSGEDVGDARMAGGDRARLVEQQDLAGGELLERGAALHDDTTARGTREARHDRDRRGEDERARRRDHEHRDRPLEITRDGPRDARDGERDARGRRRRSGRRAARTARSTLRLRDTSRTMPA